MKKKIQEHYRIISLDGSDVYKLSHPSAMYGKLTAMKDGETDYSKFNATFDVSLDTQKLAEIYPKHESEMGVPFIEESEYLRAIINLSFDYAVKQFEQNGNRFIRFGHIVTDEDFRDHLCIREVDGVPTLIAVEIPHYSVSEYAPVENPAHASVLGKYFIYDDKAKAYRRSKTAIPTAVKAEQVRDILYRDGFDMDGIHYVRYKRSAGASRGGRCLFIAEPLHADMMKWSACGLSIENVSDLASWEAYTSLTMSSMKKTVILPKKAILIIPDRSSVFKTRAVCVEKDAKTELSAVEKETEIENVIWDGQGLLDVSVFEDNELEDYGMLLLRNRFFKSCAFCTRLQDWFKDNGITQIRQLGGYTTARNVSDIKLVITESSLKYLKFVPKGKSLEDGFRMWLNNLYEGKDTSAFGVVKTDQLPSNMGGAMTYTNYQLLNTVPIAPENLMKFLTPSFEMYRNVQNDSTFLLYQINVLSDTTASALRKVSADNYRHKTVIDMMRRTPLFEYTDLYADTRYDVCKHFKRRMKKGKVLVTGNYQTLFGNPYEFLKATIDKNYKADEPLLLGDGEIYTIRFKDGAELVGSRNPHITMGNMLLARNKYCPEIDKYFELTDNIVCINAINSNLQQRLNGCDYDSDTMLITNDSWIIEGVKLCYERFGVPVCKIDPMGKTAYENTPEGLAQLDRTIAKNHIGEIINLSQFLNCLFWDRLMSDEPFDSLMPLYREICKLAVLSGMEIDKAKRMYDVNADKVLRLLEKPRIEFKKKNGGKLPNFFYFMVGQESNVSPDNKATMNTPMAYLYDAVENLDRKQRENRRVKLSELFELNTADADSNDSKRKRKIIETVLAAYDELKHLKIKEDDSDSDSDTVIAVERAKIFKNCLDTVKKNVTNDHVLHLLLKELDLGKESEYSASRAKSLLFACLLFEENGRLLSKVKTPGGYSCAELDLIFDMSEIGEDDDWVSIYGYPHKIILIPKAYSEQFGDAKN